MRTMNKTCLFIVGLPGSGKTYLGSKLAEERQAIFIDDPKRFDNVDQNIVVADPNLCREEVRKNAKEIVESFGFSVEWLFFENDPAQCKKNAEARSLAGDDRKVNGSILLFSKVYFIPNGEKTIPVYGA